ncbi:hypothetical protein MKX01_022504 [Papaver californicum]|nr:hypothetical protein MKX01_022504 [Papaver californicum]
MAERITRRVNIQRLEVRNPLPEAPRIENRTGLIQIVVTKKIERIVRIPDCNNEGDKIENLCLPDDTFSLVYRMLYVLQVPADRDVQERITRFIVDTAERAIRGSALMKSFLAYVELEVNTIEDNNDQDFDDGDERISDGEDLDMASDEEIISDEEFTSDNNEINMVVALSLDAYENKQVGASRSAIDGLKRERYSYESGGDNPAKNNCDTNTCVICMDKFESGTVVTYMPCSHIFHEVCRVPWLQENNSCPLYRLEIQSGW